MGKDLNEWCGIGRLVKSADLKQGQSGTSWCEISLACGDDYKDKKLTHFFNVVFFGQTAEAIAKYTTKGTLLHVKAKLKVDKWMDKESGKERQKLVLEGKEVQFLSKGSQETGSGNQQKVNEVFNDSPQYSDPWNNS